MRIEDAKVGDYVVLNRHSECQCDACIMLRNPHNLGQITHISELQQKAIVVVRDAITNAVLVREWFVIFNLDKNTEVLNKTAPDWEM